MPPELAQPSSVQEEEAAAQACMTSWVRVIEGPLGRQELRVIDFHLGSVPGSGRSAGEGNGNSTHSSILAWEIPWTEEPGRPQCMGLRRRLSD